MPVTFGRSKAQRYVLAAEATVALCVASVRLRLVDRRRLVDVLGEARAPQPTVAPIALEALSVDERGDLATARRIGRIVARVAQLLPWQPTCLRQSLATSRMLRRRGVDSVLHLGVADVASMDAHAWVTVSGWTVNGRTERTFTAVAAF